MVEPKQKRTRVEGEEWAKRIERWRDNGLTTAEFAAELAMEELQKARRERVESMQLVGCQHPRRGLHVVPTMRRLQHAKQLRDHIGYYIAGTPRVSSRRSPPQPSSAAPLNA